MLKLGKYFSIRTVVFYLFLLFSFFPYIQIVSIGTDTQPYAILFGLLVILLNRKLIINFNILLLLVAMIFSVIFLPLNEITFTSFRSLSNYIGIFIISYASFIFFKQKGQLSYTFLRNIILIWFVVGLIQKFFVSDFCINLLPRSATDQIRGVISLAPEPSLYAFVAIFQFLFVNISVQEKSKKIFLSVVTMLEIIFLAHSALGLLFLILYFGIIYLVDFITFRLFIRKYLNRFLIVLTSISVLIVLAILFSASLNLKRTRMYYLGREFVQNRERILLRDGSVIDRYYNIYFSLSGFISDYTLPHGYNAFNEFVEKEVQKYPKVKNLITTADRIMSGYGAVLFELGFIGLLIPIAIVLSINKYYRGKPNKAISLSIFLSCILFAAIPIIFPYLGVLVGYLNAVNKEDENLNNS